MMTALLSGVILLGAVSWQVYSYFQGEGGPGSLTFARSQGGQELIMNNHDWQEELIRLGIINTANESYGTSTDPLEYIGDIIAEQVLGGYLSLKEGETYSKETANQLGESIGKSILPSPTFTPHTEKGMITVTDTSRERVLSYRADMREALAPLITDTEPELVIFAKFIETQSPEELIALAAAAKRYKEAEQNMLAVAVPQDALALHVRGINALGFYANTLDRLVLFAKSPLAILGLLRTYNEAEREMLYAFDALSQYYVRKSTE